MSRNTLGLVSSTGTFAFVQTGLLDAALKDAQSKALQKAVCASKSAVPSSMFLCTADEQGQFCLPYPEFENNRPSEKKILWAGDMKGLQQVILTVETFYAKVATVYAVGVYTPAKPVDKFSRTFPLSSWSVLLWQRIDLLNSAIAMANTTVGFQSN